MERSKIQIRAIIHGYYGVKLKDIYSAQELDLIISEYGAEHLYRMIRRLALKKRNKL